MWMARCISTEQARRRPDVPYSRTSFVRPDLRDTITIDFALHENDVRPAVFVLPDLFDHSVSPNIHRLVQDLFFHLELNVFVLLDFGVGINNPLTGASSAFHQLTSSFLMDSIRHIYRAFEKDIMFDAPYVIGIGKGRVPVCLALVEYPKAFKHVILTERTSVFRRRTTRKKARVYIRSTPNFFPTNISVEKSIKQALQGDPENVSGAASPTTIMLHPMKHNTLARSACVDVKATTTLTNLLYICYSKFGKEQNCSQKRCTSKTF